MNKIIKKYPNCYEYNGYFVCLVSENPNNWRVKMHPGDDFAMHHGSFNSSVDAQYWIDIGKRPEGK